MSGLSPQSRSIIEAAGHRDNPSPAERARLRRAVARRIGAAAIAGGVAATASSAAASASPAAIATAGAGLGGTLGKVMLALAIVGLGGVGYYVSSRPSSNPNASSATLPAAAPSTAPLATAARETTSELPSVVISAPPPATVPVPVALAPSAAASSDLEREVAQLREAHEALRDGKPGEAMNVLEQSQDDVLAEERAALRVFALCRMGKPQEARAEADRFLAAWPRSPQAARVKTACSGPAPASS